MVLYIIGVLCSIYILMLEIMYVECCGEVLSHSLEMMMCYYTRMVSRRSVRTSTPSEKDDANAVVQQDFLLPDEVEVGVQGEGLPPAEVERLPPAEVQLRLLKRVQPPVAATGDL